MVITKNLISLILTHLLIDQAAIIFSGSRMFIKERSGKPVRYVANCLPHHGYIWNYGAIPQTWEDPNHTDPPTNCKGDNDPTDVCELGQKIHPRGTVVQVKVLRVFAMIDEGETDWKVIANDVNDPLADNLNDNARFPQGYC